MVFPSSRSRHSLVDWAPWTNPSGDHHPQTQSRQVTTRHRATYGRPLAPEKLYANAIEYVLEVREVAVQRLARCTHAHSQDGRARVGDRRLGAEA